MNTKPEYTRFLPHYHPLGATFFVTFRLCNSLPNVFIKKLLRWYTTEKDGIMIQKEPSTLEKARLQKEYFMKMDEALNKCISGPTFLKEPLIAQKVIEQLKRFDGQWYRLLAYTVMPNHVHILLDLSVQFADSEQVDKENYKNLNYIIARIKGASARYINLALNQTGKNLWQPEYHDRYIRNRRHLLATIDYIKQNPVSANICTHWTEHPFTWVNESFW